MSRNDHNEWTDSLDFESLADEQEAGGFADVVADDEPAAAAATPGEMPAAASAPEPEPEPEPETPPRRSRSRARSPRRARVSAAGLGFLFALAVPVAAIGLAGALVTAVGLDPVDLWQPEGLLQPDAITDLQAHPLNLVYAVALGIVLLALLVAGSVSRAVGRAVRDGQRDARLVDRLTALRIDEEKGWQDPLFKNHPAAAAFVNENVGAWRLGEARQRRSAGLEGELQRLVRAASAGDRDGMNDRFDNPHVGSVADELLRLHDEREAALKEAQAIRSKDREEAERLMNLIGEACGWTNGAMDRVGAQGAAVEGVAAALRRLADSAGARAQDDPVARAAAAIASLRGNLATLAHGGESGGVDLEDLVDRSNKLAFQIAMEVARLGPRGERLLPMTQALEELTTEFRQAAEGVAGPAVPEDAFAAVDHTLGQVQTALEEAVAGSETWRKTVTEAAPAAAEAAARLGSLATGFDGQADRLNRAGEACALMTGLEFDPKTVAPVDPVKAPEPDLGFTRFDPFGAKPGADPEPEVEPAAEPAAAPPAAEPTFEIDPFAGGGSDPFAADPEAADADPFLAPDAAPVYDPDGFGTVDLGGADAPAEPAPAPPAAAADEPEADVLDLASFGAVRLDGDTPDLAASPAEQDGEKIYDLAEFGAVPLD